MTPTTLIGLVAATSVSAALVLAVPAISSASSSASSSAGTQKLTTSYTCDTPYGGGATSVGIVTRLPATVKPGKAVAKKRADIVVVVPAALVTALRNNGVTSLSGTASKAGLKVGGKKVALADLTIPPTPVPDSGSMNLVATGTSASFSFAKAGTRKVTAPTSFAEHVVGKASDTSYPLDIACSAPANTALGTLKVAK